MDKREPYWHAYHAPHLIFWMTAQEHQERLSRIKETKHANEILIRLELIKKVKGRLPEELYEAGEAYEKAREAKDKAREAYHEAGEAYEKARGAYDKEWDVYLKEQDAYCKAHITYKDETETLHKKECGCEYWNGKEIVFPESEAKNESSGDI